MKKKPQDEERELALVDLFDLTSTNSNRIGIDAEDDFGNRYEIKTTTKAGVSTARDVGLAHLKKWRSLIWICARGWYEKKSFHFDEIYVLFPKELESWFCKIERKLTNNDGLFERILTHLKPLGYTDEEMTLLQYTFKRGVLLNDPNIPWTYVQQHGHKITENHALTLRSLAYKHKQNNTE